MLIDTHAHLNFIAFDSDRKNVIEKCLKEGIWTINVGTNFATSKKAVEIAESYKEGVYAAVGLHPINLSTDLVKQRADSAEGGRFEKEFDHERYKELTLTSKKVVAIGEIGLDYWRRPKTKKKQEEFKKEQKELLLKEIELAQELNLPVIFHCRFAQQDLLDIISSRQDRLKGVIHCFSGTWQEAERFLEIGLYIGLNGIIFKLDLDEVIRRTPLDRILIETDCPYLTPSGFFKKRNNPLGIKYVAERIAKVKNISFEQVAEITTQNAKNLFRI